MKSESRYSIESDPSECSLSSNDPSSERMTEAQKMNSMKSDKLQYSIESDPDDQVRSIPVFSPIKKRSVQDLESPPLVKRRKLQGSPEAAAPSQAKPEELYGDSDGYVEFQYYWYDTVPYATDDEEEELPLDDMKLDKLGGRPLLSDSLANEGESKLLVSIEPNPEECSTSLYNSVNYPCSAGFIQDLESSPSVKRSKLQESPVAATPLQSKPEELYGDDDDYVKEDEIEFQFQYYWCDPVPDGIDDEEEEVPLDDMKSDKLEYSIESDPEECPSSSNDDVSQKFQTESSVSIESDPEECSLSPNHDPVTKIRKKSISMESDPEESSTSWNKNSLVAATSLQTKPDELRSDDGHDQNYAEEVASNSVSISDSFDGKEDDVESRYNAYNEDTEDYSFYYWCYSDATDDEDEVKYGSLDI